MLIVSLYALAPLKIAAQCMQAWLTPGNKLIFAICLYFWIQLQSAHVPSSLLFPSPLFFKRLSLSALSPSLCRRDSPDFPLRSGICGNVLICGAFGAVLPICRVKTHKSHSRQLGTPFVISHCSKWLCFPHSGALKTASVTHQGQLPLPWNKTPMGPLVHTSVQAEGVGYCSLGNVCLRPIALFTEKKHCIKRAS